MTDEVPIPHIGYNEGESADLLSTDTSGWGQWSDWSECSKPCGGGVRRRTRDCLSAECVKDNYEREGVWEESCNTDPCPASGMAPYDGTWQIVRQCQPTPNTSTIDDTTEFRCMKLLAKQTPNGYETKFEICDPATEPNTCGIWSPWNSGNCTLKDGKKMRSETRNCEGGSCLTEDQALLFSNGETQTREVPCGSITFFGISLYGWILILIVIVLMAYVYRNYYVPARDAKVNMLTK